MALIFTCFYNMLSHLTLKLGLLFHQKKVQIKENFHKLIFGIDSEVLI
jgi:hypothetical protein